MNALKFEQTQLEKDIERGIEIREQIAVLSAELKTIEARIQAVGELGPHEPLKDKERDGKQFIARSRSHVLPVLFESDILITSFKPDSLAHKEIAALLGDKLPMFFKDTRIFERVQKKDGDKFRKLAKKNLEPDTFAKLIRACTTVLKGGIPKSRVVVDWKQTKPADSAA